MNSKLLIIDISSFIFRAFYAIRPLHSPKGVPVNAVYGVLSMLLKLFEKEKPDHILVAKDSIGPSFRHELYPEYKANRTEVPEDLIPQFDIVDQLLKKMQLPHLAMEKYEADDIIGSLCIQWQDKFDQIFIVSSDKDLMQFINDKIKILDTLKNKVYGRQEVFDKMGVWPEQIVDYLSMLGDSSDNVPGMKGIGAKGAAGLLGLHQTLESCIEKSNEFTGKRLQNAFTHHVHDALLSKKLVSIPTDLDLAHTPTDSAFEFYPTTDLIAFLKDLGFKGVVKKIEDLKESKDKSHGHKEKESESKEKKEDGKDEWVTPQQFDAFFKKLKKSDTISVETTFSSFGYLYPPLSFAVNFDSKKSFYLPVSHEHKDDLYDKKLPNLKTEQIKNFLEETISNSKKTLIGNHLKKLMAYCRFQGIKVKCRPYDNLLANYLSSSTSRSDTETLALHFLDHHVLYEQGKNDHFEEYPTQDIIKMSCEKALLNFLIWPFLREELDKNELVEVYEKIEAPLTPVLAQMETNGIKLNEGYLTLLKDRYTAMIEEIQSTIEKEIGETINLNSPKQVAALLFEKLNLPPIKKIKTGFSTDVEVLSELTARAPSTPIPGLIIRYRELEKLVSTYIKALPNLIHPQTKRLHTHFNQVVTATGRLSSDRPNLQNIPIRTEYGKKIRKAFIAEPGCLLLSADYSQIELRLLAHLSSDPTMIKAFLEDLDIHAQTASEVLGISLNDVTKEDRSRAKAVNFGLMYGQSSFGLAKALRISRKEAKDYIVSYFERFAKVKSYLDELKEECAKTGYSITLYGRKRFLPDIRSENRTIRANAERMAVNSPIQGTAADLIKLAMVAIDCEMKKRQLKSKMVLQIHDELVFEIIEEELAIMRELVPRHMESVTTLQVPLKVDCGVGINLYDLK
ncbi:MAG: DNA polymerase I [Bacteriovoracales bacterium]|nr:DNA polymerase I [Bacteriovoracales bacterium]